MNHFGTIAKSAALPAHPGVVEHWPHPSAAVRPACLGAVVRPPRPDTVAHSSHPDGSVHPPHPDVVVHLPHPGVAVHWPWPHPDATVHLHLAPLASYQLHIALWAHSASSWSSTALSLDLRGFSWSLPQSHLGLDA